ncbi:MAG: pilus assembly protein PilM [Planctomycetota bacterium]|nr:pilus assembly protein PilM [Planctomycetota bacterium]
MAQVFGLDLGARAIKVVVGKSKGPIFELQRAFSLPVGLAGDPERSLLASIPGLAELGKAPGARFGLSGKELIIRYTKVPPVPLWRLKLLMDFEVREMAEQAGEPLACDYNLVHIPGADSDDETVLVAVVKEPFLDARYAAISAAVGEPKAGTPASLALFNAYLQAGALYEGEYVFLVDIGHRSVEIVLQRDGELLFARNMATGGHMLTEAVGQAFGVDLDEAERIKEQYGNVTPKGLASYTSGQEERVANALIGPVGQLASIIQSSLAFARAQTGLHNLNASRILVSGGGANLRGLPEYLKSSFGCPVERFEPESGLDTSSLPSDEEAGFAADPGRFAVALGLAVSGSKEEAFLVDLVPEAVKKKRHMMTRTVFSWLAAAAAVIVLILHYMDLSEESDTTGKELRRARVAATQANRKRKQYEKFQTEINRNNEEVAALDDLSRPGWALCRALSLLQGSIASETWIEDIDLVRRAVLIDPDDPKSKKEVRILVDVKGIVLSAKSKAETALGALQRTIQKSANNEVAVDLTSVSTRDVPGSKQVDFIMTIDVFRAEREARMRAEQPSEGEN